MKASDLKFLAEVADLARLDFEAASVSINKHGSRLVATYNGAYSTGQRWREVPDAPEISLMVLGKQFKDLMSLFGDDEDVLLAMAGGVLQVRSKDKKIDLRPRGPGEGIEPYSPTDSTPLAEIDTDGFLKEVQCASEFSARSMAKAVLTGVRIMARGTTLGLQASDGQAVLFETTHKLAKAVKEFALVAPAYDLALGLRLIKSGRVRVAQTANKNNLLLYGDDALFRCSLIAGEWPDFAKIRQPQSRTHVKLPGALVKSVIQSIKILGTTNDLIMRGDGETLHIESVLSEAGQFNAQVLSSVVGTFTFDSNIFELVIHMGDTLDVGLPVGQVPTLVESGARKFWMAPKL